MQKQRTPIVLGNARFTVYSEGCVRLEYAHGGNFSAGPSVLVGKKLPTAIAAFCSQRGKHLVIRTSRFTLTYEDDGQPFSPANLRIEHRDAQGRQTVWVPGKRDAGNLGTVTRSLDQWKWCGGPQHFPVEGILSTDGAHFVPDEPRVYWNRKFDWPECRGHVVAFDGYFFAYGNDYKSALSDFVDVFGRIPMIPRWAFGYWYSRWYAYRDVDFVNLVKRYRRLGIPIDVVVIDTDWRKGWGGYDWNTQLFPDPRRVLHELHELGCHVGLNDHPGYDNYDGLPVEDSHVPEIARRLEPLPHQGQWACDWSRKKAVQVWKDVLLGPLFDTGIDFWWVDGWIKSPFVNLDSQLWANHHYYELCEEKTKRRGLILSRWGGIGSHRYPVQFSGDTPSEWEMLRHQIEFTARAGNLGAVYWSHDIGGFFGKRVDEELFIRWIQFGSLSPMFRTHSDHGDREPWKYGPAVRRVFKKQTRIRYALAPYWYTLAWEAHRKGWPLLRPLYLEYNDNDGGALWRKHQYLIGRDLLVIPADHPVDKQTGCQRKRAYFPNGVWVEWETNEIVHGMLDTVLSIPIERIPVYVRRGAIIPCQPVGPALGTSVPTELHIDYYPDPDNPSVFELYEDDGESLNYLVGEYALTRLEAECSNGQVVIRVRPPKRRYRFMPREREWVLRVWLWQPDLDVTRASVKVGARSPVIVRARSVRSALSGVLQTVHPFAEVRVRAAVTDELACSFDLFRRA